MLTFHSELIAVRMIPHRNEDRRAENVEQHAPASGRSAFYALRSTFWAVLVGTVRVVTTGRGEGRRIFTELGAAEYRYELSINEVVGDEQSAAR